MRFAVNADRALTAGEQSVLRSTWEDAFAEIDAVRLKAAFVATMRSHVYKTVPTVGDILQHVQHADENALVERATRRCEMVFAYAANLSPDYPDRNPPQFSEREKAGIRAAGGLGFMRDCSLESLAWAKKRFVEAYIRHVEIEQHQALLPAEAKKLLAQVAAGISVPALTAGAQ